MINLKLWPHTIGPSEMNLDVQRLKITAGSVLKLVESNFHVNLQGDSNMPFDNVTDKPKKIITLAKKPETSTGQNDSIIKLVPACQR